MGYVLILKNSYRVLFCTLIVFLILRKRSNLERLLQKVMTSFEAIDIPRRNPRGTQDGTRECSCQSGTSHVLTTTVGGRKHCVLKISGEAVHQVVCCWKHMRELAIKTKEERHVLGRLYSHGRIGPNPGTATDGAATVTWRQKVIERAKNGAQLGLICQ